MAMLLQGGGLLPRAGSHIGVSGRALCPHIHGLSQLGPQRRLVRLQVSAENSENKPAKKNAGNGKAAPNEVTSSASNGEEQRQKQPAKNKGKEGTQWRRRPRSKKGTTKAEGTEGTMEASLSAEEQTKKAREDAATADRFGIEDKKPAPSSADGVEAPINVDDFNPVILGRKSRKLLDDVWRQFTKLSSPVTSSMTLDEEFSSSAYEVGEFDTPQASDTTVLVTGATGRVGRVLVRKLVLRGYKVVVLARDLRDVAQNLPSSVVMVEGDLKDPEAIRKAVEGADKVVYCASSRSAEPQDMKAVELEGVTRLAAELQAGSPERAAQPTAKLRLAEARNFQADWKLEASDAQPERDESTSLAASLLSKKRSKYTPTSRDTAALSLNDRNTWSSQVGSNLLVDANLGDCEGLHLRVKGDGQSYFVQLSQDSGETYTTRILTSKKFGNFRLPFNSFRYLGGGEGPKPLDPSKITHLSIRYVSNKTMPAIVRPGEDYFSPFSTASASAFELEIDRVKALPGGEQTDFILVSCAGAGGDAAEGLGNGVAAAQRLSLKRRGEEALRQSGLGYTIVRPGPLLEEPGGYKALVFDQGERVTQGISCADVADVCLKALHDASARNKTFEVCHEYTPEQGLEQYELVAHVPDKANNYLTPALAVLEKNT